MRGLSSKESDYSDMNIPLTSAQDHHGSNSSMGHSRYPPDSSYEFAGPNASASSTPFASAPRRAATIHKPPSALANFLAHFTGGSSANQDGIRIIHLNNPERNAQEKYLHNRISTSKYNYFTFLPKFLYEQFSKYANIFFLFTACIQQIDGVSPTSRFTTAVPLAMVLFATAIKEVMEDFKRHASDSETNARLTKTLDGSTFVPRAWHSIRVGDIVRVEGGESFPADLVLLSSSEPEGMCYIETSNLDGETNLKIKQALPETVQLLTPQDVSYLGGCIRSEQPNNSLYTFEGTLLMDNNTGATKELPLDPTQVLLRGAQLRNTNWIYGVVVFTGHESKLMRNASATPIKRTSVEKMTNVQIIFLFGILLAMSLASAIGNMVITNNNIDQLSYIGLKKSTMSDFGLNILTFLILYNNLIPISLMVTMEVVKFWQAQLINSDLDMYYEKTDTPALARTSSLVEELGQIEYIFSDKTGTLTCNEMEFRQCSIAGLAYSDVVEEGKQARVEDGMEVGVHDFKQLDANLRNHPTSNVINEFLTLLAVCHTVIPERQENNPSQIIYQASSPDEGALVEGAALMGYQFTTRRPRSVNITVGQNDLEYEILNVCEFNSTRKRMSTIVRGPDRRIKLYCKGADTVILERLGSENEFVDATMQHLEDYATEGLRTLCVAMREIPEQEYQNWVQIYDRAATTIQNRGEELDKAAELIEKNLFLLGATAIEDKLQDGVPETIHTLQQAGIKVWVLTGDRQETAINIGYSCKLIQEDMSLIICNEQTHWETKEFLENKVKTIKSTYQRGDEIEPLALIIDGKSLGFALEKDIEKVFLELAVLCKAVVCCRVSPLQKALVVKLVKRNLNAILLAIGDGANDVSMIQAAHVGVGISGLEGLQAARSADFAISQFRFLKKLLLVHGAWSYQRLSKLILFSFYKNICLYTTQFWYAFYNGFSGQTVYESWTISLYNVALTVLPPLSLGIFDQYVSARMLDRYPQMYMLGQKSEFFNVKTFWGWAMNAIYHSVVIFFAVAFIFKNDLIMTNGNIGGAWVMSVTLYTAVLATVLWKAALITDLWTKYAYISVPGSMIFWLGFFPIFAVVGAKVGLTPEYFGIVGPIYGQPVFWLTIILLPLICNLRDFTFKYMKRTFFPRTYHYVQEIQKLNIPDYRPRMERFRKAVHKVRNIQRLRRNRGFAFSQNESGTAHLIRAYDTTAQKPLG
ncbi:phospholipid-translocating ATPase [Podila verticillata NRRL 6337]|nr:phospholipid-translocating ATPase [Podila verticillata NRRL 6337]